MVAETETEWQKQGLCGEITHDLWFDQPPQPARDVCNVCPARLDCLNYALTNEIRHGIWGGWTADERNRWLEWPQQRRCISCGARSTSPRCGEC